jgi:hypothetical protein
MCGMVASWSPATLVVVTVTLLAGCSSVPIPPTYTQDELKAMCQQRGGWWRPGDSTGGFCAFRGP